MSLEPAIESFRVEAEDLLSMMEQECLELEHRCDGGPVCGEISEAVNAIFRAAHTIKGSAGIFGFDNTVQFTHEMETLLMAVREERLALDGNLLALLLECGDHLHTLIEGVSISGELVSEQQLQTSHELTQQLRQLLGVGADLAVTANRVEAGVASRLDGDAGGSRYWHISLRFDPLLLQGGMDPISFIRYLSTVGEVISLTTITDGLPDWKAYDPEICYLGFEISLRTECEKTEIEGCFEFILDDCDLRIIPPHSSADHFIELIQVLPEQEQKIGAILVNCEAITERELQQALQQQQQNPTIKIGSILQDQLLVEALVVDAAEQKQQRVRTSLERERQLLRVDAVKLDQLINLIGELVITNANANMQIAQLEKQELQETSELMAQLIEEIRGGCLR